MVRDRLQRRISAVARVAVALSVVGAGLLAGQGSASAAPTAFFVDGREFFSIDLATGESDLVGSTDVDEFFSSLAFGPDGKLFAVADSVPSAEGQFSPAELYTINVSTGTASLIGRFSENNDTGMTLRGTALTFSADGTALMTGVAPGDFETVFVVDIDGTSAGLVPVSRLTSDSGFLTLASETDCDGTIYGLSFEIPDRSTDDVDTPTTATVGDLPPPGSIPAGVGGQPIQEAPAVDGPAPQVGSPSRTQQPEVPTIPMVLTTIDPATGTTTKVGDTGLNMSSENLPGLAVDRATDTMWGAVFDGSVFTIDEANGAADLPPASSASDGGNPRQPQNLAISPVSCSQPTTTTTSTTTSTTSTTVVTADEPDPPPAAPATPVPAQPNFTG